jgi:hypothetical protein
MQSMIDPERAIEVPTLPPSLRSSANKPTAGPAQDLAHRSHFGRQVVGVGYHGAAHQQGKQADGTLRNKIQRQPTLSVI